MTKTVNKPSIVIVTPKFGVLSEVWLYRQATQMRHVRTVVSAEHLNQEIFPMDGLDLEIYPTPPKHPRSTLTEKLFFRLNQVKRRFTQRDYYRFSKAEEIWWNAFCKRHQGHTVLFHYGTTAVKYAPIVAEKGLRYGIHFNGFDLSIMLRNNRYANRLRQVAASASSLIVVADYMKQWLLEQGIDNSKIHYLPYGVPLDDFKCTRPSSKDGPVSFLMVGRLTHKKNPTGTIRAFGLCAQKFPNVKLVIVGNGELEGQCKQFASELGLQNKIIFRGAVPSKDVRTAMCEADVFVQHSITSKMGDKEGWPVAIAEAAASGMPIVSTHHASIPEQVIDGETGFLVEEGDWQDMGQKMALLASHHDLRNKFGVASRRHISQWDASDQIVKLGLVLEQIG